MTHINLTKYFNVLYLNIQKSQHKLLAISIKYLNFKQEILSNLKLWLFNNNNNNNKKNLKRNLKQVYFYLLFK